MPLLQVCTAHEQAHGSSSSSNSSSTKFQGPQAETAATMQQARITDNFRQQKAFSSSGRTNRDKKQQKTPELPGAHGEAAVTNCEELLLYACCQPQCHTCFNLLHH
jgi:hypothetical protein